MKRFNVKLAKREKIAIIAGASVLGLVILVTLVISPALAARAKLRSGIETGRQRLQEMVRLSAEYSSLENNSGGVDQMVAKRDKGFTLFSFLEKLAREAGVKDRIKYMKPSSSRDKGPYAVSSVEMQLEGITMGQLFEYLYKIEDPENIVGIKRISIKKHKEQSGYIDATLQVLTVEPA